MFLKLINFIKQIKKIVTDKLFPQNMVEIVPVLLKAEISHNNESILQPIQQSYDHSITKSDGDHTVINTLNSNSLVQNTVYSKQYKVPDG